MSNGDRAKNTPGQIIQRGDRKWVVRVFQGREGGSRKYLNVMRRVEEYITKFSTQWLPEFRTFVLNDFNDFLWSIGAFVSVPPPKRLGAAASWLYFYCGIISLDQAHRDGKGCKLNVQRASTVRHREIVRHRTLRANFAKSIVS